MSHSKNVVLTGCSLPTARARVVEAMVLLLLTRLRAKECCGLVWVGYVEPARGREANGNESGAGKPEQQLHQLQQQPQQEKENAVELCCVV